MDSSDSNYKLTPVIDGKITEWNSSIFINDKPSQTKYAIANDANYLYVAITVADQVQQLKMINGGTEVWINVNLKKTKNIGVKFPIGGEALSMPDRNNNNNRPNQEQMKQEARSKMRNVELKGFKPQYNGVQSVYSQAQVKPVIEWDVQNNLVYELAIPFLAFQDADTLNLKNISVGIIYNGLKMPEGMQGGGGMRPPAGMTPPGGGSMPDMSQLQNLSKENSIWTKYTIIR